MLLLGGGGDGGMQPKSFVPAQRDDSGKNRDILTSEFSVKLILIGSHGARRECVPLTASYIPHDTTSGRIIRKYQ